MTDSRTAWVKCIVDGDTLLLTNGERIRLVSVDTPEVHESKKHHRDVERRGRDVKMNEAQKLASSSLSKRYD
ncbi:MAG: hypothetical protein ACFFCW_43135, partial [Candidatus Hodarchaeota archaeon]